jgi:hypothetical protein
VIKFLRFSCLVVPVTGALLAAAACSGPNPSSSEPASAEADGASIGLSLDLAPGVTINSAAYTIVGSGSFTRSGTIELATSAALSAIIGGVPAGTGYSIGCEVRGHAAEISLARQRRVDPLQPA